MAAVLAALLAASLLALLLRGGASRSAATRQEDLLRHLDTGDPADFGGFSHLMNKHPAVIQTFRTWGSDFPSRSNAGRTRRRARSSTSPPPTIRMAHELITPAAIAQGSGDGYLVRLNKLFWEKEMRAYIRPLGEPNRCLNVYAPYDCAGKARDADHSPRALQAGVPPHLRVVHGGGKGQGSTPAWRKPACRP